MAAPDILTAGAGTERDTAVLLCRHLRRSFGDLVAVDDLTLRIADRQTYGLLGPTGGVDPQSRNAILTSVEALSAEGMAVLYTTHYMEEAQRLCDRIGVIDMGRLIAEGTVRELTALVGASDRVQLTATGALPAAA